MRAVTAIADDGSPLTVMQTAANRWRVDARGAQAVRVRYRLECSDSSVTTNWVGDGYAGLSNVIAQLQGSAGRRVQTLEESSLAVWENSFSGLRTGDDSVSYYVKGHVVGFLLDVHIRRATGGARSLDDLMRLAFEQFSGDEAFTPEAFARAACEVAGYDITGWLAQAVASTDELAYDEALGWFGLAFAGDAGAWQLQIDALSDTGAAERRAAWLGKAAPRKSEPRRSR